MKQTTITQLAQHYDALLFDAYGVLVDDRGAIPGTARMLEEVIGLGKPYFVLSNDASKLPATAANRFHKFGLPVGPEQIVTSGMLLEDYFSQHALRGARALVLGTDDSAEYARRAGAEIVDPSEACDADVVILADDLGFDLRTAINTALNIIINRFDRRQPVHMLLVNPDLLYPEHGGRFAFAAGSMAAMIEAALVARYPYGLPQRFLPLGKPYAPIFEKTVRLARTRNVVLIGDQLLTDIKGANDFGISSALVAHGITDLNCIADQTLPQPTYIVGW